MPLTIPPGLTFADLELELGPDGGLRYLPGPLTTLAAANGIQLGLNWDEDQAMAVICAWYVTHREAGGQADAVAEAVVAMLNARGD